MKKSMVLIVLGILPFLYSNCAKSSGSSQTSVVANTDSTATSVIEVFSCNRPDIGVVYEMDTYSDSSRKITCSLTGAVPTSTVQSVSCPDDSPMELWYYYPQYFERNGVSYLEGLGSVQVTLKYSDSQCSTQKF